MSTRYGLVLKLDCSNAAFSDGARADEIARILRKLADDFDGHSASEARYCVIHERTVEGGLRDTNGNRCGAWEAKRRRVKD